jgi:hypothetical protein
MLRFLSDKVSAQFSTTFFTPFWRDPRALPDSASSSDPRRP